MSKLNIKVMVKFIKTTKPSKAGNVSAMIRVEKVDASGLFTSSVAGFLQTAKGADLSGLEAGQELDIEVRSIGVATDEDGVPYGDGTLQRYVLA
jgi:uncharacterized membrane protein